MKLKQNEEISSKHRVSGENLRKCYVHQHTIEESIVMFFCSLSFSLRMCPESLCLSFETQAQHTIHPNGRTGIRSLFVVLASLPIRP